MNMWFYGEGDSKGYANIENIYRNEKVSKYECILRFMAAIISRPLQTLETYIGMK